MKKTKKFFSVLTVLAMIWTLLPAQLMAAVKDPTEAFYVNDFAGVLSDSTKNYIMDMNEAFSDTGAQFVVVTVDFTDGEDTYDYAFNTFNTWGVGDSRENNGFLLLLSIAEEDYTIVLGIGAEDIISDGESWVLLETYLEDDFDVADYDAGVRKTAEAFNDVIVNYYSGGNQSGTNTATSGLLTNDLTAENARYINDDAGVLKDSTIKNLTNKNEKLWEMNGGQIAVVTVNTVGNNNIEDYTIDLFNTLGVGDADNNNGVLMLLSIDDKEYYFALGDGLAARVRESEFSNILEKNFNSNFKKGNYDKAVSNTFDAIYDLIVDLYGDDTAGYAGGAVMPYQGGGSYQSGGGSFGTTMGDAIVNMIGLIIFVAIIFAIISIFSRPRHTTVVGMPRRRFFFFPYPRRRYYGHGPYWGHGRGHMPPPPSGPVNNPGPAPAPQPQRTKQPNSVFGGGSSSVGMGKSGKTSSGSSSGSGFGSSGASRGGGATRSSGSSFGGTSRSSGSSFGGSSRSSGGSSRSGGGGMSRGGGASRGGKR